MNIILYNNVSENNRVNKVLTDKTTVSGALRGQYNLQNPTLAVQGFTPDRFNYLYVPDFDRYYFITNVTTLSKTQVELTLECDVLMTFRSSILNLTAIISASETGNRYLASESLVVDERQDITLMQFSGDSFSENGEYILITAGG